MQLGGSMFFLNKGKKLDISITNVCVLYMKLNIHNTYNMIIYNIFYTYIHNMYTVYVVYISII